MEYMFFFFQAEDGIRDADVTGVQTCALPIYLFVDERVRIDVLQERVRQKMETLADKQVYLRGDATVTYQDLMEVFDRLKSAGVDKVGLVTKRSEERRVGKSVEVGGRSGRKRK